MIERETLYYEKKSKAMEIAKTIVEDNTFSIEDLRLLFSCLHGLGDEVTETAAYLTIQGIESQTDHFPLGIVRERYSQQYLSELDNYMRDSIKEFNASILKACKELITILK